MKTKLMACVIAAAMVFVACDKDDDDDNTGKNVNNNDRSFVLMASMANTAEIDAGQLASAMGTEDDVRDFGEMMVGDHTNSKSELEDIANDFNLASPDSLDAAHVALKQQLMSLSGREFDSVYIHSQVKDHEVAISLYTTEAQAGANQRLREYATATLPHLQQHLDRAREIATEY